MVSSVNVGIKRHFAIHGEKARAQQNHKEEKENFRFELRKSPKTWTYEMCSNKITFENVRLIKALSSKNCRCTF